METYLKNGTLKLHASDVQNMREVVELVAATEFLREGGGIKVDTDGRMMSTRSLGTRICCSQDVFDIASRYSRSANLPTSSFQYDRSTSRTVTLRPEYDTRSADGFEQLSTYVTSYARVLQGTKSIRSPTILGSITSTVPRWHCSQV
jgi:hypothetical protein